ncbi:MAG: hypothetical protein AAFN59_00835 [Pseudomonadota bacterium]
MFQRITILIAGLFLAGCTTPSGVLVSERAIPLGGNLFVENPDTEDQQVLVLDGPISSQTAFIFLSQVAVNPDIQGLVIAQSPGGNLAAAHQIGRQIQSSGMNTFLIADCASACVDIFIAGQRRDVTELSSFLLHAASNPEIGYQLDDPYWTALGFKELNDQVYALDEDKALIIDAGLARRMGLATHLTEIGS